MEVPRALARGVFLRVIGPVGSWPKQIIFKPMTEARRVRIGRLNVFKFVVHNIRGTRGWSEYDSLETRDKQRSR